MCGCRPLSILGSLACVRVRDVRWQLSPTGSKLVTAQVWEPLQQDIEPMPVSFTPLIPSAHPRRTTSQVACVRRRWRQGFIRTERGWMDQCFPTPELKKVPPTPQRLRHCSTPQRSGAQVWWAQTRWRMLLVGQTNSTMFMHQDDIATATWQAQVREAP